MMKCMLQAIACNSIKNGMITQTGDKTNEK